MEDERSSSAPEEVYYDVFLSFRGPDTRLEFVDFLYNIMRDAGIKVYLDENELVPGQKIEMILPAIDNSRICMPVFSKDFASSSWCLREVERMVDLKKEIIPIFYHVTSDDVKLKTSLYKDQLKNLRENHSEDKILRWEAALRETGKSKGRELKDRSTYEFVNGLVKDLLIKLKIKHQNVPEYLVGIDFQLEAAMKLLNVESGGVLMLGIYGTGGIGKTTVAKYIFNKIMDMFGCYCFLDDIAGELSRNNSIVHLLERLLVNLDPKLKDLAGSTSANFRMQNNFKNQKVLIVLDNVDQKQQVQNLVGNGTWFGMESRIIVTSRDDSVLGIEDEAPESSSRSQSTKLCALEMNQLNPEKSLQLFCWHAFKKDYPKPEYKDLASRVVDTIGGLPLALEVIGLLLQGKDESFWKAKVAHLKQIVHPDVKEKLKISFDALEISEQQIFLDIACFFITYEVSRPIYMWEACDLYPTIGLSVLISRSLVKIQDGSFWMHDQLKILGREIARDISFRGPKCFRFYEQKEAMNMLMKYIKGKKQIVGLQLNKPCDMTLTADCFADLFRLRYLSVSPASLTSGFHHPLPNLKWLVFHSCPANFDMRWLSSSDLVILDLSRSFVDGKWQGWSQMQTKYLKVLDLSYCQLLEVTPSFSNMVDLSFLDFSYCVFLMKMAEDLFSLKNLKYLHLRNCLRLRKLSESLGKLKLLVILDLRGTAIAELPDSVGELKHLEQLLMRKTLIKTLPETFGGLESLVVLDLSYSTIEELPNSIGRLKKLQELSLDDCFNIKKRLPESLGDLESLVRLNISRRNIMALPASIYRIKKLKILRMEESGMAGLPSESGEFPDLMVLVHLHNASDMQALSSSIRQLSLLNIPVHVEVSAELRSSNENIEQELLNGDNLDIANDVDDYDLSLLLSSPDRDFLIRNNGQQVQIDRIIKSNREQHVTLLFSASWCVSSQVVYLFMKENYLDEYWDVFIFVSLDEDDESFWTHFSLMPWLAIPFSDSDKCRSLVQLFKVTDIPHIVKLDKHGKVVSTGLSDIFHVPYLTEIYPNPVKSMQFKIQRDDALRNQSLTSLLVHGFYNYVLSPEGIQIPASKLEGKIIGLYFSRPFITPRAIQFHERLVNVYEKLKRSEKNFEIVSVRPSLNEIFMSGHVENFLILPMNYKRFSELLRHFVIKNLPALVIIGSNGETLNVDAAHAIKEHGAAAYPFTMEKLAEIGWEVVGQNEAVCRKLSLKSAMALHESLEYVISSNGSRIHVSELQGKVLGVYFFHDSQSCIEFTINLLHVYKKLNIRLKRFEVVLVYLPRDGSDYANQEFLQSFGTLPWLLLESSLATTDELASYFKVTTVPSLVIIGKDGNIVNFNAVHLIRDYGAKAYPFTPEKLVQLANVKKVSGEIMDASLWPMKLQHDMHDHQLVSTNRNHYICDLCNERGTRWSYCCKDCDFDLHCTCALEDGRLKTMSPWSWCLEILFENLCP